MYECKITSNWFSVKNENQLRNLVNRIYSPNGIRCFLWDHRINPKTGQKMFRFGIDDAISGLENSLDDVCQDAESSAYDEFIDGLQEIVSDNDAIIIYEVGSDKLNYLSGMATIITSKDVRELSLIEASEQLARELLGMPEWMTVSND